MNTSKSFVRACFWPGKDLVISGSEDASVCLWDSESCHMVQRLKGHTVGSPQRRYRLPNAATRASPRPPACPALETARIAR